MKTLVEIHILQNFAPSNLNRDDTGAPKDALFGGTRRARISSQCFKRANREYLKANAAISDRYFDNFGTRSKRLLKEIVKLLETDGKASDEAKRRARLAMLAGLGVWVSLTDDDESDPKSEYLMFLGQNEIKSIAEIIADRWDKEKWEAIEKAIEKKSVKNRKKVAVQKSSKELKQSFAQVMNGGKAVDIALFGRMLADMPEKNQHAACQVAHAISTHVVEREFDFYTAVDDLKPEDTAGADMMGTVEFNSACFYRYALIDWGKLVGNLQGDTKLAAGGLRAFLEGFVVAEPTGKQNTFAAHNPPEFVVVSVRQNTAPRSLANAFETAIRVKRDESLTLKSAEALVSKAKTLQTVFGGTGKNLALNLTGANLDGFGKTLNSFKELLDETISTVQE